MIHGMMAHTGQKDHDMTGYHLKTESLSSAHKCVILPAPYVSPLHWAPPWYTSTVIPASTGVHGLAFIVVRFLISCDLMWCQCIWKGTNM